MHNFKKGDRVSVINETISGTIVEVNNDLVVIEDNDGFNREYSFNEIAILQSAEDYNLKDEILEKEIHDKIAHQIHENKAELRSFEIDLHIEELIDSHANMTNHEILMKQMSACRNFVQQAIEKSQKRIVLIHGKGEGVLKAEIHTFLHNISAHHEVQMEYHDAPYHEYGMGGATEILFY
jgi:dsDNA-specific endonuclease/ATPase MutS2